MIQKVEEHWNCDIAMAESEKNHVLKLYRETMLQAYNFGFEVSLYFNSLVTNGFSHPYHLDGSTFILRGVRCIISLLFHFSMKFM